MKPPPPPPYSAGALAPRKPAAPILRQLARLLIPARFHSATFGSISASTKRPTCARNISCSSVKISRRIMLASSFGDASRSSLAQVLDANASCGFERPHADSTGAFARMPKIVGHLHSEPGLRSRTKGLRKANRHLDRYCRSLVHHVRQRLPRDAQSLRDLGD